MHNLLAASQGPAPPPPTVVIAIVTLVILGFGGSIYAAAAGASRRRRAQAPGRAAVAAREVTASWRVKIQTAERMSVTGAGTDTWRLNVRGEFVEVMQATRLGRALNGREYYIPAREASIRVEPGFLGRQWLVITGTSSGQPACVWVSPTVVSRVTFEEMRLALTAAGARPERP